MKMLQSFAVEHPELLNTGGHGSNDLWLAALKILNYHNVDRAPEGARLAKLYVDPAQFARQMACLEAAGAAWGIDRGCACPAGPRPDWRRRCHHVR